MFPLNNQMLQSAYNIRLSRFFSKLKEILLFGIFDGEKHYLQKVFWDLHGISLDFSSGVAYTGFVPNRRGCF